MTRGRPSKFDQSIADQICAAVSEGETLRAVCRKLEIPHSTVLTWVVGNHAGFYDQYTRAREAQLEAWADLIVAESEDSSKDTVTLTKRDGTEYDAPDHEWIARSRLRVDTYKWLMSKLGPKKYGDKVQTDLTVGVTDELGQLISGLRSNGN